jgi:hypothetical protein
MMKVVNANPGMANPMTEEERNFDVQPNAKQHSTAKRNGLFVSEGLEGVLK